MANEAVTEPVAPAAPPETYREFKAQKAARAAGSTAPPADKQAPAVEQSGTAGASATPPQETQEKKPRAKNAEDRAAELRAAGRYKEAEAIEAKATEEREFQQWKAGKADRDREAEELRQLRASRNAPAVAAPPPAAPAPAAASPAVDPTEPDLEEYIGRPENKDLSVTKVTQKWQRDWYSWNEQKRQAETAAANLNKTVAEREEAARQKYPDYDQFMKGQNFVDTIHRLHRDAIVAAATELPNGTEVLYRLAKDPAEVRRIAGLSSVSQVIELGVMSRAIAAEGTKPPEKPATPPPVSRTPPPVRTLSGIAPSEAPEAPGTPKSYREYKARKAARAS